MRPTHYAFKWLRPALNFIWPVHACPEKFLLCSIPWLTSQLAGRYPSCRRCRATLERTGRRCVHWVILSPWLAVMAYSLFELLAHPGNLRDYFIAVWWKWPWLGLVQLLFRLEKLSGTWLSALFQPKSWSCICCWQKVPRRSMPFPASLFRRTTRQTWASSHICYFHFLMNRFLRQYQFKALLDRGSDSNSSFQLVPVKTLLASVSVFFNILAVAGRIMPRLHKISMFRWPGSA